MLTDARRMEEGFELAELARRLANVVRAGTVASVDLAAYRVRVAYDTDASGAAVTSAPVPWVVMRAGADRTWWAPRVGEQVLLLCPSGELVDAIALPALYSDAYPAPSASADKRIAVHADGARFEYDRAAHRYSITLPDAGEIRLAVGASTIIVNATDILIDSPHVGLND